MDVGRTTQKILPEPGIRPIHIHVEEPARLDRASTPPAFERRTRRGSAPGFLREHRLVDRIRSLGLVLRWGTTILCGALALRQPHPESNASIIAFALVVSVAAWRSVLPEQRSTWRAAVRTSLELALLVAAITLTNGWSSPYIFIPLATMLAIGVTWGWWGALAGTVATSGIITVGAILFVDRGIAWTTPSQLSLLYLLAGALGAVAYRSARESAQRFELTRDDQTRLAAANDLLTSLHSVASTLSAPLDLVEVVTAARERCHRFGADHVTLVLADATGDGWRTEFADGVRIPANHDADDVPPLFAAALRATDPVCENDFARARTSGWSPVSRCGMAVSLRSREHVLGVLMVEYDTPERITHDDEIWFGGLASNLALSIDNAQWFARIRSLGAEAERNRLARDLHDRLAQSLAYVAIELERIDRAQGGGTELERLCGVVRDVVAELRSTLYELRVTPSEEKSLIAVLKEYTERFSERTGIAVTLRAQDDAVRFARPIEVELWRILQESLTNVERHASATRAWVTISSAGDRAIVEVRDNGKGFRPAVSTEERYGLVGMRERADAINAHLTIDSEPGAGTCVRVEVEVPK